MSDARTTYANEGVPSPPDDFNGNSHAPERRPGHGWRWLVWVVVVLALSYALYHFWPKQTSAQTQSARPAQGGRGGLGIPPVSAIHVKKGDIGVYVLGLGAVTPISTVTVRSRVDGELLNVPFKEGDIVHKGDLLADIDPRPFQAQLTQYEGQLTKDQAALENARLDQARYETLLTHNAVAEQQLATQKATVTEDEGAIKVDQGQIETAKLNITYSHITAPITGRVGLRLVDPGNIVHASDTNGMLVITQVQPISVIFTIAEDQIPAVLKRVNAGQVLGVDAFDRDMKTKLSHGVVSTMDNQIDQTTGTLKLRAIFTNQDSALFPNQFVNARLQLEEKHGVLLIPNETIQRNSQFTYVYVVKPDSTVTLRRITTGTAEGDQTEVTSGLVEGDVVVATGVDKLQEGSKVEVHLEGEAK